MLIQTIVLHRARLAFFAIGALVIFSLGMVTGETLPMRPLASSPAPEAIVVHLPAPAPALAQRALVSQPVPTPDTCGAGVYVSGDLAGEASPAAILSTMCGQR